MELYEPAGMPRSGQVLVRGHGFPVDHIALAFRDTEEGVRHVERLTGVRPRLTKRDRKEFFWSAALEIGEDSFLEVFGPNPDHRGIHPLKSFIAGLDEPRLLFWYIATDDFAAMAKRIEDAGERLKMVVTVDEQKSATGSGYTRAAIGSGFVSQRPGLIEWRKLSLEPSERAACRMTAFSLSHPKPDAFNDLFAKLGVDLHVAHGPSQISLSLDTPKGEVVLATPGTEVSMLGMLLPVLRRPFG